ncbi:MAG: C-type lectin domain-containing protein [Kofleriaceae bacterium]
MLRGCGRFGFESITSDASITDARADGPVIPPPPTSQNDCPVGYTFMGTSCYLFVSDVLPWLDAEQACEGRGVHLVVVDDAT